MITKDLQALKPLRGDEELPRDSEYLGAEDIDQSIEPILTIKNIYRGKVTLQRGKEVKNVLTFVEETVPGIREVRPLILNSGNRQILKKLYGQVTANALEGKKIQLWIEHGVRNPAKNELTDGIRIKDKKPTAVTNTKPAATLKCADCGKEIAPTGGFSAEQIASASKSKYGRQLCMTCGQKAKAALEAANTPEPENDLAAQLAAAAEE